MQTMPADGLAGVWKTKTEQEPLLQPIAQLPLQEQLALFDGEYATLMSISMD